MGKLTDKRIQTFRFPSDRGRHADGDGLFLVVKETHKSWLHRFRFKLPDGRWSEKTLTLGRYPAVSLAEARRENARLRALEADGVDTAEARKAEKAARVQARLDLELEQANTFQTVALEWMDRQRDRWRPSHDAAMRRAMEKNVFPVIGARPIDGLTPPDVATLLQAIEARGAPAIAEKVLQGIRGTCRYAVQIGRATFNPAADMRGVLKPRREEHHRALPLDAMPGFLQALRDSDRIHVITKSAVMLTILCATRTSETLLSTWGEVDLDKGLWLIPAERMKAGLPHTVPLSRQALRVIVGMERWRRRGCPYIFPGIRGQALDKPLSGNTMLYALYRLGYHGEATMHGFRAVFTTVANEAVKGFDKDAIERALAHQERNRVRAAYHRSEYLEERRVMLQWWADWLEAMERSGKVEPAESYLPPGFR